MSFKSKAQSVRCAFFLCGVCPGAGQRYDGHYGTVKDSSGAAVAGAVVTVVGGFGGGARIPPTLQRRIRLPMYPVSSRRHR